MERASTGVFDGAREHTLAYGGVSLSEAADVDEGDASEGMTPEEVEERESRSTSDW